VLCRWTTSRRLALLPITRDLLGVEEPSSGTKEAAVEVFHGMGADDFDGEKVLQDRMISRYIA